MTGDLLIHDMPPCLLRLCQDCGILPMLAPDPIDEAVRSVMLRWTEDRWRDDAERYSPMFRTTKPGDWRPAEPKLPSMQNSLFIAGVGT
jgi:hypothetical protein